MRDEGCLMALVIVLIMFSFGVALGWSLRGFFS